MNAEMNEGQAEAPLQRWGDSHLFADHVQKQKKKGKGERQKIPEQVLSMRI